MISVCLNCDKEYPKEHGVFSDGYFCYKAMTFYSARANVPFFWGSYCGISCAESYNAQPCEQASI